MHARNTGFELGTSINPSRSSRSRGNLQSCVRFQHVAQRQSAGDKLRPVLFNVSVMAIKPNCRTVFEDMTNASGCTRNSSDRPICHDSASAMNSSAAWVIRPDRVSP